MSMQWVASILATPGPCSLMIVCISSGRQCGLEHGGHVIETLQPDQPLEFLAVFEDDERRDASDLEPGRQFAVVIDVDRSECRSVAVAVR